MRKQLLAGVAFTGMALAASGAYAADPIFAPAPVAPPHVAPAPVAVYYNWSGFYVGGHLGFNWENKKIRYPGFEKEFDPYFGPKSKGAIVSSDPIGLTLKTDGFHGGLQGGVNWQMGQFVLGGEVDFSWTNADGSKTVPFHFEAETRDDWEDDFPYTFTQKIKWFGTARLRAGWAFDNVLIYGTGGFAWKRSEITLAGTKTGKTFGFPEITATTFSKDEQTHKGWALGLGGEVGITENLSFKLEWLYMDLGRETYDLHVKVNTDFDEFALIHTPTRVKLTEHVVRVGLNWRFVTAPAHLPMAPVPAKY